jgi:hypothetical protein
VLNIRRSVGTRKHWVTLWRQQSVEYPRAQKADPPQLSAIDPFVPEVQRTVAVGGTPSHLAFDERSDRLWVATSDGAHDTVRPFVSDTFRALPAVAVLPLNQSSCYSG